MKRWSTLFSRKLTVAVMLLGVSIASAPARADDKADAKAAFLQGVEAFGQEDYPNALIAFENSYNIRPKAKVLYNIGMCQKALYRYSDSIKTFEKYLDEVGGKIKPKRKKEVNRAISDMNKLVGRLKFSEATTDAEVLVNAKLVGMTPLEKTILVDPGQHVLTVKKEGFETLEINISASSDAVTIIRAVLVPLKVELPLPQSIAEPVQDVTEKSENDTDDNTSDRMVTGKFVDGDEDPEGLESNKAWMGHFLTWTGLSVAGAGVFFNYMAWKHGQRCADPSYPVEDERKESQIWSGAMWGSYGYGLVALPTGLILMISARKERRRENLTLAPMFVGRNYGLVLKGEW